MQTETERFIGYVCDECDTPFTVARPKTYALVHCPECNEIITSTPNARFAVNDTNIEQGFYQCFECGHMFGYSATELENKDSVPNCTECGADNTELMV